MIHICHGTACHVKGSQLVHEALARQLKITSGGDTDAEGLFTIEKVACLGCCTLAPVVQIDGVTYGHLTPHQVGEVLDDFLRQQDGAPRRAGKRIAPVGPVGRDPRRFGILLPGARLC